MKIISIILIPIILFIGCDYKKNHEEIITLTNSFFHKMQKEEFEKTVDLYSEEAIKLVTKEKLVTFLTKLHSKLGKLIKLDQLSYVLEITTEIRYIYVIKAQYEDCEAIYKFNIIEVSEGVFKIHGFNVESDVLSIPTDTLSY